MALNRVMPGMSAAVRQPVEVGNQRSRWVLGDMVGRSAPMERLFLQMRYLANHLRLALIEGEHGTGKRLAARTLHELGPQRSAPLIECAAREFFTGGMAAQLEAACGGTLYLTCVDDLDHEQQGRLLHLAQWVRAQCDVSAQRLNAPRIVPKAVAPSQKAGSGPRVLLVSSTRALRPLVLYGRFRAELQQQLAAVHLLLPPLRDRGEDVALLAAHFLARLARSSENVRRIRELAPDALPCLLGHKWPGNVAELEEVIAQGTVRAANAGSEWLRRLDLLPATASNLPAAVLLQTASKPIPAQQQHHSIGSVRKSLPAQLPNLAAANSLAVKHELDHALDTDPSLERAMHRHIQRVLARVDGNKLRAARLLGISRSTLYRHLDEADRVLASAVGSRVRPVLAPRDLA